MSSNRIFQNYHCHKEYTNVRISDSAATLKEYAARARELGHGILSSCEHGWQGNYYQTVKISREFGLKPLICAEAYWVKDREEKDRSNCHIFIAAMNENGRQALNDVLSEANITGFYGQPRLDIPLILSLPKDDVVVTTACVAYWRYDDVEEITKQFAAHFGKNFFLEVQYHNTESQRELNRYILELHRKYNIPIIMGCDSHYIFPDQAQTRADFLASKGLTYENEDDWYLDYPDGETAYKRFAEQCVLSDEEICEAMENTNVFLNVEEYNSPVFNEKIKLPTLYPDLSQEERNEIYKKLVWDNWAEYKKEVPENQWSHYEDEINKEIQTVVDTRMADYFIDNYYIIKKGKENGGWLTKTGRGCFTKDAMVPTLSGFKHINDVCIGDYVFDKDGVPQRVIDTLKYDINEPLIEINYGYMSKKFSPLRCTLDHKILVRRGSKTPDWIEAKDLRHGDYVCCPKFHFENKADEFIDLNKYNDFGYSFDRKYIYEKNPYRLNEYKFSPSDVARVIGCGEGVIENIANKKRGASKKNKSIVKRLLEYTGFNTLDEYANYIQEKRTIKIKRFIPNDFFTNIWIGCLYGDGFCSKNKTVVGLAINPKTHKDSLNRMIFSIMANRFGLHVKERISRGKDLSQLTISSNIISNFIHKEFFISKKGDQKNFNTNLFFQSPENLEGLRIGFSLTDGSYKDRTRNSFDNTSLNLIGSYKILTSATTNYPITISRRKSFVTKQGYVCKDSYKVRTYFNATNGFKWYDRALQDSKYTYLPVISTVILQNQETSVYDLTVENSHSYVLNNIVIHNSGVSFITNKLLGFTEVDRVSAKVHMYPERFMSTTRILESGSLPDLDQNCAPVEPFARAQKEILGEDHSYPMIAYGTMQKSAAWKLYAKSQGINFEIANAVSSQIRNYEFAVKHLNEEEAESVDIKDYIDDEFHEVYEKSKDYLGLVTSWSIAPCSYLLYSGSIRKEIGLVKVKDNLCCIMDGHWAEECHFLKNDLLKVSVVDLIYRAYHRIGMEPPSVPELLKMCGPNDPAWDIYARSCTLGINQCEQKGTSARVAKYKPKNISELAAFVAAIRPGFKSMYKTFESRQHFDYGVKAFDDLIQTEEMHDSFLLYQEQEMAALNYAGIEMSECYTAIKNIAKKRAEKVISYKNKFIRGFQRAIMEQEGKSQNDARAVAVKLWKIIEDSANYSFNACLTPDTKVMMADGTSLPLYELIFKWYDLDGDKPVKTFPELYALSLDVETGKVIRNRIIDVRFADFAKVYELTTADGFKVQCTSNHKFPTPDGVVALKHLSPGDCVYTLVDGEAVKFTKVESIVELQEECVLDIEMQAPAHNLFVNGGLLVSNSHSYCVALDSLYCAWLKAHHPLEFYETLLKISEEKNDKDKMYEIREEANDYFGISFPPFKFGQDNREIKADLETRAITNAITSIKGFSQRVADVLYECGQQKFEHFTDVLKYLFARSIKVAKVAPLISINYFSDYGNIPTLSAILRAFIILKEGNAKIIKKENIPDEMLFRVFEWACDSNDWAFKVNGQADLILTEYEEYLRKKPKPDAPLKTKIRYSLDVLGYADVVTGKPEDRKRLFIKDVTPLKSSKGDVWAYRVSTKSVGTGKEARITIKAGTYEKNPIKEGDIIKNPDVWKNPAGYWYLFDYEKESDFEN